MDYLAALHQCTEGIALRENSPAELKSDLLRNRSIANLHLHRYERAAEDAVASLTVNDLGTFGAKNSAKAHYRAGCALYHQSSFNEALVSFRKFSELLPADADCLREIRKTETCLR